MTFPLCGSSPTFGLNPELLDDLRTAVDTAARPSNAVAPTAGRATPVYTPDRTGDPTADGRSSFDFLSGPLAAQARQEFQAAFHTVRDFAAAQGLTLATGELTHLLTSSHLLESERLSRGIKEPLERLAEMVNDPRIALADRSEILNRLSGLDLCCERCTSELRKAALELAAYCGDLRREIGVAFVQLCGAHLLELLRDEPRLQHLDLTTPHALLPFTQALRLPGLHRQETPSDRYALDIRIYQDVVARCGAALEQRIDAMTIADWLADRCLDELRPELIRRLGGETPDFMNGAGHFEQLERVLRELSCRFGPLNPYNACALDEDLQPSSLIGDARLLAMDIRRNMAATGLAPAPAQVTLDELADDAQRQRLLLVEGRHCVVVIDRPGDARPLSRPPTVEEALVRLDQGGHVDGAAMPLDERARASLVDLVVARGPASVARRLVAEHPTAGGVRGIVDRVITDDDTLAGWMSGCVDRWPAPVLAEAFEAMLDAERGASLAALLRAWTAPGFPQTWMRLVRREASRNRARNVDARVARTHSDDDVATAQVRPAPCALLDRLERVLGGDHPLRACRAAARAFRAAHPIGPKRHPMDESAVRRLAQDLRALPPNLAAAVLSEDGGLSGALEASLFALDASKLRPELALVRRLSDALALGPEATGALLQVSSPDRYPTPFPLLGAALLMARTSAVDEVFAWTREMASTGHLDTDAVQRLLLPDTLSAEHARSPAPQAMLRMALEKHLRRLSLAAEDGLLSIAQLQAAAGLAGGAPSALLRTAVEACGDAGKAAWGAWRDRLALLDRPA